MATLLPPTASDLERHVEASADRLPVPAAARQVNDPYTCPPSLLAHLAWSRDVLEWDDAWATAKKRLVIAASIPVHHRLGTIGALKQALVALGYSAVQVLERSLNMRNASISRNGVKIHGSDMPVFYFDIVLNAGNAPSAADIAAIRRAVSTYKNARSWLRNLFYVSLHHDAIIARNGAHTHSGGLLNG